jgi:putative DNA primase/helicase
MYERPFEMAPQFKLWIAANDRPGVRSSSNAFWRRVKSIPFVVNISDDDVIRHLERELHEERDGIFNWILEGVAEWAERGLAPPEQMIETNRSYRDEMDPLHRFLAECVTMKVGWSVKRSDLFDAYVGWCSENREEPLKGNAFGRALASKGFRTRHSNGTFYRDAELTEIGRVMLSKAEQKTRGGW